MKSQFDRNSLTEDEDKGARRLKEVWKIKGGEEFCKKLNDYGRNQRKEKIKRKKGFQKKKKDPLSHFLNHIQPLSTVETSQRPHKSNDNFSAHSKIATNYFYSYDTWLSL